MPPDEAALASLSSLDDRVRGALYEFVSGSAEPVGRDEAAAAAGIGRALAVYHLDKLVEVGLLTATYRRPEGRRGPGAGRPAKFYSRSGREFAVSVPPREYELAARLLVEAVRSDDSGRTREALRDAAARLGAELGSRHRAGLAADPADPAHAANPADTTNPADPGGDDAGRPLLAVLREHGFEPFDGEHGTIRLRNCPFHLLAEQDSDLVCHMNLALIEGISDGLGASAHPVLDKLPGGCCVAIHQRHTEDDRLGPRTDA
jgi:predicted ArsR family transcriptional regulator